SLYTNRSVLGQILDSYPITLQLAAMSTVISVVIGVPAGVISALKADSPGDHLIRVVSVTALALPTFWTGAIILTILGTAWGYAPPFGYVSPLEDPWVNLQQTIWPAVALGLA